MPSTEYSPLELSEELPSTFSSLLFGPEPEPPKSPTQPQNRATDPTRSARYQPLKNRGKINELERDLGRRHFLFLFFGGGGGGLGAGGERELYPPTLTPTSFNTINK